MNEHLESALNQAYELIEANRIDEARVLLEPLLEQYPDEPDLWWVYAHAVDNQAQAQNALNRVVELDDSFADAEKLLKQIETTDSYQPPKAIKPLPLKSLSARPSAPESQPDIDFDENEYDYDDDDFDDDEDDEETGVNWLLITAVAALFTVIAIVAIVMGLSSGDENVSPTDVAANPTETTVISGQSLSTPTEELEPTSEPAPTNTVEPTEEPEPTATATTEPTDEPQPTATATTEPTATPDPSEVILNQLSGFDLSDTPLNQISSSQLGETLLVEVCLSQQENRNALLTNYFDELVNLDNLAFVDAIGITLVDCDTQQNIRSIAVPVEQLDQYRQEVIDQQEFQLSWMPVG